jgi:hypothetical protein
MSTDGDNLDQFAPHYKLILNKFGPSLVTVPPAAHPAVHPKLLVTGKPKAI